MNDVQRKLLEGTAHNLKRIALDMRQIHGDVDAFIEINACMLCINRVLGIPDEHLKPDEMP